MSAAPCCQRGLRALISRKLGRCSRCMRSSALGTLAAWVIFAAISVVRPHPALLGLGLLVAVSFTLLLLAHLVVLVGRVATLHDALHAGHSASIPAEFRMGRRTALLRLSRATLWVAVFGLGLFRMPREAEANVLALGPDVSCVRACDAAKESCERQCSAGRAACLAQCPGLGFACDYYCHAAFYVCRANCAKNHDACVGGCPARGGEKES